MVLSIGVVVVKRVIAGAPRGQLPGFHRPFVITAPYTVTMSHRRLGVMQAVTSYSTENDNDGTDSYLCQAAHLHKCIESKFHRTTFRALLLAALPSSNFSRRIRIRITDHLCRLVQRRRRCRVHTPLMYPLQRLWQRYPFSLALMRFRPDVSSIRLGASRWLRLVGDVPFRTEIFGVRVERLDVPHGSSGFLRFKRQREDLVRVKRSS